MVFLERKWFALLFVGVIVLSGCAQLRANNERHYYRETLWSMYEIPESTKEKCGYDYDAPYPGFVADENIATNYDGANSTKKRPHLKGRIVIHYNPHEMEKIRHETVHYLNRMKLSPQTYLAPDGVKIYENVSWECLDEMLAQSIANELRLRDQLGIQKARTRYYRHKAGP